MNFLDQFPVLSDEGKQSLFIGREPNAPTSRSFVSEKGAQRLMELSPEVEFLEAWISIYRAVIRDALICLPTDDHFPGGSLGAKEGFHFPKQIRENSAKGKRGAFLDVGAERIGISLPVRRSKLRVLIWEYVPGTKHMRLNFRSRTDECKKAFQGTRINLQKLIEVMAEVPETVTIPKIKKQRGVAITEEVEASRRINIAPPSPHLMELQRKMDALREELGEGALRSLESLAEEGPAVDLKERDAHHRGMRSSWVTQSQRFVNRLDGILANESRYKAPRGMRATIKRQIETLQGLQSQTDATREAIRSRKRRLSYLDRQIGPERI